jgi:hypothetical protein
MATKFRTLWFWRRYHRGGVRRRSLWLPVLLLLGAFFWSLTSGVEGAWVGRDPLLEVLIRKGYLTPEEASQVQKEANDLEKERDKKVDKKVSEVEQKVNSQVDQKVATVEKKVD